MCNIYFTEVRRTTSHRAHYYQSGRGIPRKHMFT